MIQDIHREAFTHAWDRHGGAGREARARSSQWVGEVMTAERVTSLAQLLPGIGAGVLDSLERLAGAALDLRGAIAGEFPTSRYTLDELTAIMREVAATGRFHVPKRQADSGR